MRGGLDFGSWLSSQLESRGWTQARLAKKSRISPGQVARVLNNTRDPGPEFCRGIARALDLPEELVFRQAGLLSPEVEAEAPENLMEWMHLFRQASPEDQARMLELARVFRRRTR